MPAETTQTSVSLSADVLETLRTEAKDNHRSVSKQLDHILDRRFADRAEPDDHDEPADRR